MQKSSNIALDRNRNSVVHVIPEHFLKGKQRERTACCHVVNLLRAVEKPEHVSIKRALRLRRWPGASDLGYRDPRPTLVEFAKSRRRGRFSVSAGRIKNNHQR